MTIAEAKSYIGCDVALNWLDRKGQEQCKFTHVYAADFVPLYGPCLVTDEGEIRLDRIVHCTIQPQRKTA